MKTGKVVFLTSIIFVAFSGFAGTKTLSFDEAVIQATNIKGCNKKLVTKIQAAHVAPPMENGPKGIYLEISSGPDSESSIMIGPLAKQPTKAQLASLKEKSFCEPSDG